MKALLLVFLGCAFALQYPHTEWTRLQKSSPVETVTFTLALKLNNLDALDDLTVRLTTPGSPEFRQWKTIQELNEITKPDTLHVGALLHWLSAHSLTALDFGDFIQVSGSISDIEKSFKTDFYAFENALRPQLDVVIHRSIVHPTIPAQFRGLVLFVTGLSNFPYPSRPHFQRTENSVADNVDNYYVVPQTLRNQYNVDASYVATNPASSQGLVEFGTRAGISISDLQTFMSLTGGDVNANLTYTVGNFQFNPHSGIDVESTLDVQYIMAMAPGVPTSFYVVDGWIYDFTTLIQQRGASNLTVPKVFSVSYGWAEGDQCDVTGQGTGCGQLGGNSASYVENTNAGLQKLGLMGISIFVSSGDAGAATKQNLHCRDVRTPIQPDYPASSSYVTAVGGTMFSSASTITSGTPFCGQPQIKCASSGVEVVCQLPNASITSGGGFSNVAPLQSWQTSQVNAYLKSGAILPPSSQFNSSGRAYPDITALAHHFLIVENGVSMAVDGTSASAPLTAGIFALINDNILNNGGSPLGFLNPALYAAYAKNSAIANDITVGDNTTTEKSGPLSAINPCHTAGYGAVAGWDAVSGIGSPNYPLLLAALA